MEWKALKSDRKNSSSTLYNNSPAKYIKFDTFIFVSFQDLYIVSVIFFPQKNLNKLHQNSKHSKDNTK